MADAAPVEINFPGPPTFETRSTTVNPTSGTDTKTEQLTPEQQSKLTNLSAVTNERIALAEKEKAQRVKAADVERQNIEAAQFAEQATEDMRHTPEAQAAQDYVTQSRSFVQQQQKKYEDAPPPRLFADRDGWGKVKLAVSMGLAGLGDGMISAAAVRTGHAPIPGHTVNDIISRDLDRQRMAIEKLKDNVVTARTGLSDAVEARRALLADVDLRGAHMHRQVELLMRQRLAGLKLDQAAIDSTKEILDAKEQRAKYEADFVKGHTRSVTARYDRAKTTTETINRTPATPGGGGGVEADTKAAQFALFKDHAGKIAGELPNLSTDEINQINRVMSSESFLEGKGTVNSALQSVGLDAETATTPRVREYLENVRRGSAALGRMDSGAAIGTVENIRFQTSLMPKNSDTKTDLEMRAKNINGDIKIRGDYFGKPAKYGAGGAAPGTKPNGGPPPPKAAEFTKARVEQAKGIATDKKETRERRDAAREYIKLARDQGVE